MILISGLKSDSHGNNQPELSLTSLEERRHQAGVVLQVFKIVNWHNNVNQDTWFKIAAYGAAENGLELGR
jgi:hypothetical protein